MTRRRTPVDSARDVPGGVRPVLVDAAEVAGRAPSIFNTQPWQWKIRDGVLELRADRSRQVRSIDPQGRLLTLSCGAALHHARVALQAAGHAIGVTRIPAAGDGDLLAQIQVIGEHKINYTDVRLKQAMRDRRTDRRPFAATRPVRPDALAALDLAALGEGAQLHRVHTDQLPFLVVAARAAQTNETKDERYLADLKAWTRRSHATGEGVPAETIVATVSRPVSLRDFARDGEVLLHPGFGDDQFAEYLIVATDDDTPVDWLVSGEAASAVWLTATGHGLAVSPMSDVVEVPGARALVASLLPEHGHPQLVLRIGFDIQPTPPPASPRRRANVEVDDSE
jgi:hypothetical protein